MKIKFYVLHWDSSLFTCFVVSNTTGIKSYLLGTRTNKVLPKEKDSRVYLLNSYGFYLFLNELDCCPTYHAAVARNARSSNEPFVVKLVPNKLEFIDKTWGEIVRVLVWEQLETDHMMSWLSTLGGAFSALGDYFENSAEIAGKISIQQMKLALRSDDPGLIARCLLYLSISLIQKHKFKTAQRIIRAQFTFAKKHEDVRLTKMCLGIWSKLQYTHQITRLNKKTVTPAGTKQQQ